MINPGSEIIFKPIPSDDRRRKPDISKAKGLLNWEPKISLDERLKSTIEYFRQLVLGSGSEEAIELMQDLYAPIINREYAEDRN